MYQHTKLEVQIYIDMGTQFIYYIYFAFEINAISDDEKKICVIYK